MAALTLERFTAWLTAYGRASAENDPQASANLFAPGGIAQNVEIVLFIVTVVVVTVVAGGTRLSRTEEKQMQE
jgi:hypothetical protein